METRLQKKRHSELLNSVFSNDLLLDKILDYVIHDGSELLSSNARTSRLICRNWNHSISRILLKSHEPLFQIRFEENMSICGTKQSENLLQEFQNLVIGKEHLNKRVPPYSIKADALYFEHNDCQDLFTFLKNCGTGLVKLDVSFSDEFHYRPLHSNTFLPQLGSVTVNVLDISEEAVTIQDEAGISGFIQSIFESSQQLKSFRFHSSESSDFRRYNLGNLVFPSSITDVTLMCTLIEDNLGALAKNHLPNLRDLQLRGCKHDGIISSILQNVRNTLVTLILNLEVVLLSENDSYSGNALSCRFKLPRMEKLESLDVNNMYLMDAYSSLKELAPMLNILSLTPIMLDYWLGNSPLQSVFIVYVKWDCPGERTNPILGALQPCQIDALHNACPNLVKLDIDMEEVTYIECVKMIWRKLTRLKVLTISIVGTLRQVNSADVWDALLIGIPEESVDRLRKAPELWEELQLTSDVSIRNLTDLHTLILKAYNEKKEPLISNAAFLYAFMRMPELYNLRFVQHFYATKQMKEQWRKQGRVFKMLKEIRQD